jgi:hypothetical protein
MRIVRRTIGCLAVLAAVSTGVVGAAPTWAPAETATIHPGVQVVSPVGQCTANFVFSDAENLYIGQAAHCTSTGGPSDTNGCSTPSLPIGTPITIDGASQPGVLAYNSWIAMQTAGETDPDACAYNDFALVRIDAADAAKVNPSIPHWGGPVADASPGTAVGSRVYSYGNSSLRLGVTQLSPKTGVSLGTGGDGWTHTVYTVTPGIPGDSGSAYLDGQGRALGVLSTVQLAALAGSNGVSDIGRAVAYMRTHGGPEADLALGTEPFTPNRLPLAL